MPVPSQGHYGFHSFSVVDWFCMFIYLWVLTFPLLDCSEFGNFVITLIPHLWLLTGLATRVTRRVAYVGVDVEHEHIHLPEHMSSPPGFSGVRVARSLVSCVLFLDHCLFFCPFSFGHCIVCPLLIYGFWLHWLYLKLFVLSILILILLQCALSIYLL